MPDPLRRALDVYVPRLLVSWLETRPADSVLEVDGTMAFVDISGFTRLTERLARRGRVGAEEMSDILDDTFGALLTIARADGAELVKWGGDAVLLLFDGADHVLRACRAAARMRTTLREHSRRPSSAGAVTLRMSVGIHSGRFHFFLVGDPSVHRELIVSGPAASVTAEMEAVASAGQIALSEASAALVPRRYLGEPVAGGRLLRGVPDLLDVPVSPRVASKVDVGQLLPPMIRTHLSAASGESEHRPVAVAFVQFSGTDALLRDSGAQALCDALDECVRNVQEATSVHQVTFFESDINRDGGKIMLVAGAPRTAGDDAERMLRAVRQIIDNAGILALRAGVNRGYVYAGDFGPAFRRTYSVKGDAINLAARVMAKASVGEVLATDEVTARSRTAFDRDALEPFLVKGKTLPVHAARLGRVRGELPPAGADTSFVGREDELVELAGLLSRARSGSGTLVDIVGEPGIGKSRLVAELTGRAAGMSVVSGRSGAYESTTAYYPFRSLLREAVEQHFGAARGTDPAPLLARLGRVAPELTPWLPLVGIVADVRMADTVETRELDEQFRRGKLEEVTVRALTALLDTPTVLVFENVHLMDDASADLLRNLEASIASRPWTVVVTRRDQDSGYRPTPDAVTTHSMRLGAMPEDASLEMLSSALGGRALTRQALRTLVDRAGGNPLFLSSLAVAAGRSASLSDLPDSVEGVITAQIDRLDPYERTVLRYAAVLGMRFPESDLHELASVRSLDVRAVDRIADFVHRDDAGGMQFRHALIRDVAYAGLPFRLRRELHAEVGRAIEARLNDASAEPELLALHFFHAGLHDKAWTYSRLAGERAHARYAYAEAAEFLERAVEAARRSRSVPPRECASVLERLGDVRALAGSTRAAIDAYRHARVHLSEAPVPAADLFYKQACLVQRLARFTQSLHLLQNGLRRLEGVEGASAAGVRAKLLTRYGFCRYLQGRTDDAIRWCERGVAEGLAGDDDAALAMAYNALHLAHLQAGLEPGRSYAQLALEGYEELGDLSGQGHSSNTLAIDAHRTGRWDDAERLFGRAAEIFGRIGDVTNESNAVYNRCDLLIRQGRYVEAEPLLADVVQIARAVDDEELVALATRELARSCAGQGRPAEAAQLFDEAERVLASLGLRNELLICDAARAEAALRTGDAGTALQLVERASAVAHELGVTGSLPWLTWLRAGALLELGAPADAAAAMAHAVPDAPTSGSYERAMMLKAQARLAAHRGSSQPSEFELEASAILAALGVVSAADPFDRVGATG